MAKLEVKEGVVATYMHNAVAPNMGKIGVLVALESTGDKAKLAAIGKQIAMHVAHSNPQALDIASVDPASIERERAILTEQAQGSGKPAEVIAKMVEGRLRKFYEQEVLLEQTFVIDNENQVKKVVENAAKEVGASVKLTGFARFALGEGIAKEQADAA
jgi:elongation factor Ts